MGRVPRLPGKEIQELRINVRQPEKYFYLNLQEYPKYSLLQHDSFHLFGISALHKDNQISETQF